MRATRPINAIALSNVGDFSSKRNETFDDVWLIHSHSVYCPLAGKSKDARSTSTGEVGKSEGTKRS
jgi:hypothetical protein